MSRSRNRLVAYRISASATLYFFRLLGIAQYVTLVGLSFERIYVKVKSCLAKKAESVRVNHDININSELAYGRLCARGSSHFLLFSLFSIVNYLSGALHG